MKKLIFLIIIITFTAACNGNSSDQNNTDPERYTEDGIFIFNVSEIEGDPAAFSCRDGGDMAIRGTIVEIDGNDIKIIDTEQLNSPSEDWFFIYARYDGDLPNINDNIVMVGDWIFDEVTEDFAPIFGVTSFF